MRYIVEFLAVAREEDRAGAGAVSDADDVALDEFWAVGCSGEGLVVASDTVGDVCY